MNRYWILLAGIIILVTQHSLAVGGSLFLKYRNDVDGQQSHNDAVSNLITTAVEDHYPSSGYCSIDPKNKSVTVRNLRFHCNSSQLQRIFYNLKPRSLPSGKCLYGLTKKITEDYLCQENRIYFNLYFPGSYRGYTILGHDKHHDGLVGIVWHGKNFNYPNGLGSRGTVTNNVVHVFELLRASIFPSVAPMDGKEAFEIDYRGDILSFLMVDYLRNVQPNLYLGYFAFRAFDKIPVGYFLLERD